MADQDTQKIVEELVAKFGEAIRLDDTSAFHKLESTVNAHRIYVQKGSKGLRRIDTTLPVQGQEGTTALNGSNGKITCHILPSHLEHFMAMLTDATVVKVEGKARPFQPKAPKGARVPSASATPAAQPSSKEELEARLKSISERTAAARARRKAEETGSVDVTEDVGRIDGDDLQPTPDVDTDLGVAALALETGIDVSLGDL